MQLNQLKDLLKHIITEVEESGYEPKSNGIKNLKEISDRDYNDPRIVAHSIYQPVYLTRFFEEKPDGSKVYEVLLFSATGPKHYIKQTPDKKWFYFDRLRGAKWFPADEHIKSDSSAWDEYQKTGKIQKNLSRGVEVRSMHL